MFIHYEVFKLVAVERLLWHYCRFLFNSGFTTKSIMVYYDITIFFLEMCHGETIVFFMIF